MQGSIRHLFVASLIGFLVLSPTVQASKKATKVISHQTKSKHYKAKKVLQKPDPGINPGVGRPKTQVLSPDKFEKVDPTNGKLTFDIPSLTLPGPAGLDIKIHFVYNPDLTWIVQHMRTPDLGNYWRVDFGIINNSPFIPSPNNNLFFPVLYLPDGTQKMFFLLDGNENKDYMSQDNWKGTVDSTNQQFTINSPKGLTYIYKPVTSDFNISQMKIAEIDDTHGNWIKFEREDGNSSLPAALTKVTTSDGREIDFNYTNVGQGGQVAHLITSMVVNGQTWNFKYTNLQWGGRTVNFLLSEIDRPDGTSWQFQYAGCPTRSDGFEWWHAFVSKLTTPYAGTIDYQYKWLWVTGPNEPGKYTFYTLTSQTINDNAGDSWTRNYAYNYDGSQAVMTQTVTDPTKKAEYQTYGAVSAKDGTVWRVGLPKTTSIYNPDSSTPIKIIGYQWDKSLLTSYKQYTSTFAPKHRDQKTYRSRTSSQTITQDGTTYTTTYSNFDQFDHPQNIVSQGQATRTTDITYLNNTTSWILDSWTQKNIQNVGKIDRQFDGTGELTNYNKFGVETTYTYTPSGNLTSKTDANSNTTNYTNYKRGKPQEIDYPIQGIIKKQIVNDTGTIASITDPLANTNSFEYDALNRVTKITPPKGTPTTITYNGSAGPGGFTEQRGNFTQVTKVDGFGHPIEIDKTDTATNQTIKQVMKYDINGRQVFKSYLFSDQTGSASLGNYTTYDALGRIVKQSWPNDSGSTVTYSYGANNQLSVQDPNGNVTVHQYQSYGNPDQKQLMSIQQPQSITTKIERNGLDQITKVIQGNFTRSYAYNDKYFLTSETDPETGVTTIGRDNIGLMTSRQVGDSGVTNYVYDAMNQLTNINYPSSTAPITIEYDKNGRVIQVSNGPTWSYGYDANSNLTDATLLMNSTDTYSFTLAYNALDHLTSIIYPDNTQIDMAPNAFGWPTKLGEFINSVSFFPNGKVKSYKSANGTVINYTQNDNNLLSSIITKLNDTDLINYQYNYDLDDNLTSITDNVDTSNNISLGYDKNNRLISANGPWGSGIIAYDDNGNILLQILGKTSLGYSYNKTSNLLDSVGGSENKTFKYDTYGNVTSNGNQNFTYNDAQQLIKAAGKDSNNKSFTIKYDYDGNNNRVSTNADNKVRLTAYLKNELLYALDFDKKKATNYIYLGGHLVAKATHAANTTAKTSDATYPIDNILGSPVLATDAKGKTLWQQTYLPYGHERKNNDTQDDEHISYIGKEYNKTTQLSYLGARYYDPMIGRFMSTDPKGFTEKNPLSFNLYAYGNDSPYRFKDPRGKAPFFAASAITMPWVSRITGIPQKTFINNQRAVMKSLGKRTGIMVTALSIFIPIAGEEIAGARGIAEAKTLINNETIESILKPGGKLIGKAGSSEDIRVLKGGKEVAEDLFAHLTKGAKQMDKPSYKGQAYEIDKDSFVGYRSTSKSGPPTIDINIPGLENITKLKFPE